MRPDPIDIILALPAWLVLLVFSHPLVAVVSLFLLFRWARPGRSRAPLARTLLLVVAIAFTGLAAFFVYLGFAMRWSTDGPGLLIPIFGIGGFGILAIATWILWAVRMKRQ